MHLRLHKVAVATTTQHCVRGRASAEREWLWKFTERCVREISPTPPIKHHQALSSIRDLILKMTSGGDQDVIHSFSSSPCVAHRDRLISSNICLKAVSNCIMAIVNFPIIHLDLPIFPRALPILGVCTSYRTVQKSSKAGPPLYARVSPMPPPDLAKFLNSVSIQFMQARLHELTCTKEQASQFRWQSTSMCSARKIHCL